MISYRSVPVRIIKWSRRVLSALRTLASRRRTRRKSRPSPNDPPARLMFEHVVSGWGPLELILGSESIAIDTAVDLNHRGGSFTFFYDNIVGIPTWGLPPWAVGSVFLPRAGRGVGGRGLRSPRGPPGNGRAVAVEGAPGGVPAGRGIVAQGPRAPARPGLARDQQQGGELPPETGVPADLQAPHEDDPPRPARRGLQLFRAQSRAIHAPRCPSPAASRGLQGTIGRQSF